MAKYRGKQQYFEPKYKETLITGLLGCRWRRYKQIKQSMSKCDIFWFITLLLITAFSCYWFYFWLVSFNSSDLINWYMYKELDRVFDYHMLTLILSGCTLTYLFLLIVLALCHTPFGHQVWIHYVHRIVMVTVLIFCLVVTAAVAKTWSDGFTLTAESIMITGPFLHVIITFLITLSSWFIFVAAFKIHRQEYHYACLALFSCLLVLVYVWPVFVQSPCISDVVPPQPKYLAHRGASVIAPENTIAAFSLAGEEPLVEVLESDVTVSWDGVPFVMHDHSLKRSTNAADVFGQKRADLNAASFTFKQVKTLSAGLPFLQHDVYGTVSKLDSSTRAAYANLSVPSLLEYLQVAIKYNKSVMFDIKYEKDDVLGHPFNDNFTEVIIDVINNSGIQGNRIWWLNDRLSGTKEFTFIEPTSDFTAKQLKTRNINKINVGFASLNQDKINAYNNDKQNPTWTNVYVIDSEWTHSLFWCMGVKSITTSRCKQFASRKSPVWHMKEYHKLLIWLLADTFSFIVILIMFIYQRKQRYRRYETEASITNPSHTDYRTSSIEANNIATTMSLDGGFVNLAEIELKE